MERGGRREKKRRRREGTEVEAEKYGEDRVVEERKRTKEKTDGEREG